MASDYSSTSVAEWCASHNLEQYADDARAQDEVGGAVAEAARADGRMRRAEPRTKDAPLCREAARRPADCQTPRAAHVGEATSGGGAAARAGSKIP